jgi:hypothetical protein
MTSLAARRIPVYVWVPIILACTVAGVFASKLRPLRPAHSTPPVQHSAIPSPPPVAASPAAHSSTDITGQGSRALGSPGSASAPASFPTDELDLPTPAPKIADRPGQQTKPSAEATRSAPSSHGPGRARAARDHSLNRARRPQNIAQQPAKAPSTASSGLKSVPIIGPVISLFQ